MVENHNFCSPRKSMPPRSWKLVGEGAGAATSCARCRPKLSSPRNLTGLCSPTFPTCPTAPCADWSQVGRTEHVMCRFAFESSFWPPLPSGLDRTCNVHCGPLGKVGGLGGGGSILLSGTNPQGKTHSPLDVPLSSFPSVPAFLADSNASCLVRRVAGSAPRSHHRRCAAI